MISKEFQRVRIGALTKAMTSANEVMAKKFLEETIVPSLREQQKRYSTDNYFVITFYVLPRGNISYNNRVSIECKLEDPNIYTNEDVLLVAVDKANEYGITAKKFHEDNLTVYRFEIHI